MFSAARHSVLRQARTQLRLSQPTALPQYSAFARLLSTLAVLEQKDGKLNIASLAAVTAGEKLGGSITAFVAGSGVKSVAEEAAKVKGVEKIIYVENRAYDKVGPIGVYKILQLLIIWIIGLTRELCAFVGREHQEGRIHPYSGGTHCIRQESDAPCGSAIGHPADLRCH